MVYCAGKLIRNLNCLVIYHMKALNHNFYRLYADKPLEMLEEHLENSKMIYEFFECSSNIPNGFSASKPSES